MTDIFMRILDLSWQASWLILAVLFIRWLLKPLPKRYSLWLWALPLLRLVLPISFSTPFSPIVPIRQLIASEASTSTTSQAAGSAITSVAEVSETLSHSKASLSSLLPTIGIIIWILGIVALAGVALYQYIKLSRSLRFALQRSDNIIVSELVDSAFVMGVFRPKIILPTGLGETERDIIIAHEKTHISRGDHISKLIAFAALCLHWFNPLVWVAYFSSARDMEMACDERLIKDSDTAYRKRYSQTLLNMTVPQTFQPVTPLSFGSGDTTPRIKHILSFKPATTRLLIGFGVIILALIVFLFSTRTSPLPDDFKPFYRELYQATDVATGQALPAVVRLDQNTFTLTTDLKASDMPPDDAIIDPQFRPVKLTKVRLPEKFLNDHPEVKIFAIHQHNGRDAKYRLLLSGSKIFLGRIDNQIKNELEYLWSLEETDRLPDYIHRSEVSYEHEPTIVRPEIVFSNLMESLSNDASTQNGMLYTPKFSQVFRRVSFKRQKTQHNSSSSLFWTNPEMAEEDRVVIAFRGNYLGNERNRIIYQGEFNLKRIPASAPNKVAYQITLDSNKLRLLINPENNVLSLATIDSLRVVEELKQIVTELDLVRGGNYFMNRLTPLDADIQEYQGWYHEPYPLEVDDSIIPPEGFKIKLQKEGE